MEQLKRALTSHIVRALLVIAVLGLGVVAVFVGKAVCLDCSGYQCPIGDDPIIITSPAPPHCGCKASQ